MSESDLVARTAPEKFRANVGINTAAKLMGWAYLVHAAYPTAEILVYGSSLESKTWHDIDVVVALPDEQTYRNLVGHAGQSLGSRWDVISAAFSALAEQMVGATVEVRFTWRNGTDDWVAKEATLPLVAKETNE